MTAALDKDPEQGSYGEALVIGTGNAYRGDDAIGLMVSRRLRERAPVGVRVIELNGEASELMRAWRGVDTVILVDAVLSDDEPGRIQRFDVRETPLPLELFRYSSHAFGVAEAIELARTLGELPPQVIVFAITGESFDSGANMSAAAETAVARVTEDILQELDCIHRSRTDA